MQRILACWLALGASGAVLGCGGASGDPGDTGVDAGGGTDTGVRSDGGDAGGTGTDGGRDGGSTTDTGPGTDTGSTTDTGPAVDAGVDAASAPDSNVDAGGGCTSDTDCPSTGGTPRFCQFPDGSCGGTGRCADATGICSGLFAPVCGCDGMTYSNAGCAAAAGVNVESTGACSTTGGCSSDTDCAGTEFCDFTDGSCGGTGTCTSRGIGRFCIMTCAPECGCDGSWYQNQCFRQQAGTSVDAAGGCAGSPPCMASCGCTVDADCARGDECVATLTGGVCHTPVARPMCWRDSDCSGRRTCIGANVCPCGSSCFVADSPGTCG